MATKDYQQPADAINEFMQTGKMFTPEPFDVKSLLEFQRYKQDCRKRALDLASDQRDIDITDRKFKKDQDEVLKIADKYYQWLINLPA